MMLSPHFSLAEMTVTKSGLPNNPSIAQIDALTALCVHVLEPLRAHFGCPIIINSGFRSVAVNKFVGGAANSQHLYGEAADIHMPGVGNAEIWRHIVENLEFDQVIAESLSRSDGDAGWVHVSYRAIYCRKSALSQVRGKYMEGLHFV